MSFICVFHVASYFVLSCLFLCVSCLVRICVPLFLMNAGVSFAQTEEEESTRQGRYAVWPASGQTLVKYRCFVLGCLYNKIREEDFDRGLVRHLQVCLFENYQKRFKSSSRCIILNLGPDFWQGEEKGFIVMLYISGFDEFRNLFLLRCNVKVTR